MEIRSPKMKTSTTILALAAITLTAACSTPDRSRDLANPAVTGRTLALQVCINCHGVDGNSVSPNFPKLAGQQEAYFVAQLKGFKNHGRSDPAGFEYMWGLSRSITDEQVDALAKYYAEQKSTAGAPGDATMTAEGKQIFANGIADKNIPACAACHGAEAQGMATFPRLAGQHEDYIVKQLQVFQRTDERPEGSIMKGVAHDLTPRNMEAVATYLQALASK